MTERRFRVTSSARALRGRGGYIWIKWARISAGSSQEYTQLTSGPQTQRSPHPKTKNAGEFFLPLKSSLYNRSGGKLTQPLAWKSEVTDPWSSRTESKSLLLFVYKHKLSRRINKLIIMFIFSRGWKQCMEKDERDSFLFHFWCCNLIHVLLSNSDYGWEF